MREYRDGVLLVFLAAAFFGTLGIFGAVAPELGLSTGTLLGVRFFVATLVLIAYLAIRGRFRRLGRRLLVLELGLGIVYGVMSIAYFESLLWLSAGIAALLLFTYPIQVTLFSALAMNETVSGATWASLLAAITGIVLIGLEGGSTVSLVGALLVGLASVCYSTYALGTRMMVRQVEPLVHVTYVFIGVTATILVYGLATASLTVPGTMSGWSLIAGLTIIGTLIPMILFTAGLARIPASNASIISTSEPLTTVFLGILLLGEAMTLTIALATICILSGVLLTAPSIERVMRQRMHRLTRSLYGVP